MEPDLVQFEREQTRKIKVIRVNTDETDGDQYQKYSKFRDGEALPQTAVLKNGALVKRKAGKMSLDDMRSLLKSVK